MVFPCGCSSGLDWTKRAKSFPFRAVIRFIGWSCLVSFHLNGQRQSRWAHPAGRLLGKGGPVCSSCRGQPPVVWMRLCAWPLLTWLGPWKGRHTWPFKMWGWLTEDSDTCQNKDQVLAVEGFFFLCLLWYSELHLGAECWPTSSHASPP